jgi:hypothetical protein
MMMARITSWKSAKFWHEPFINIGADVGRRLDESDPFGRMLFRLRPQQELPSIVQYKSNHMTILDIISG